MPFRKNRRFSRPRYPYRKLKRSSRRIRILKNPSGEKTFKLRGVFQVQASSGQLLNHAIRLTQPDNFAGTSVALTDWTAFAALYDTFRVSYIKLHFIPAHPNDPSEGAVSTLYAPIYVFTDFDQIGLNPTNADTVGYDNLRIKNAYRPWTYGLRVPKLNANGSSYNAPPGWFDTLTPVSTGAVYIHNGDAAFDASDKLGMCIVTYWIKFRNRR